MSDEPIWIAVVGIEIGLIIGLVVGSYLQARLWRSKAGDAVGFRTAICSGGKFYYVVTEREYVNKVMGPLPDGSRVEIGDNYIRYSHNMPPRQP